MAGTYEPQDFAVSMTVDLPDGWSTTLYTENRFDLLQAPQGGAGPTLTLTVALAMMSPADLAASLQGDAALDVGNPVDAIVGNVMGASLDVTNTSSADLILFEDAGNSPYGLPAGQRVRLDMISEGTSTVVIARLPTTPDVFPTAISLTQPVVDSMRFFPPKS